MCDAWSVHTFIELSCNNLYAFTVEVMEDHHTLSIFITLPTQSSLLLIIPLSSTKVPHHNFHTTLIPNGVLLWDVKPNELRVSASGYHLYTSDPKRATYSLISFSSETIKTKTYNHNYNNISLWLLCLMSMWNKDNKGGRAVWMWHIN